MSSEYISKTILIDFILILSIICCFPDNSFPFTFKDTSKGFSSADEYLYHTRGSKNCTTQQCHASFITAAKKFKHSFVRIGECAVCHNPHGSDNAFILLLLFPDKFYTSYDRANMVDNKN